MRPERKLLLGAAVLIAAACSLGWRPASGLDQQGERIMQPSVLKQSALHTRS
ncbi:MAG TPA: hypothetical protein VGO02_10335 [Burkholderiales bacterium]|jgi:hypothetical protein|nr:hypothetical protein [Burkholderiales bacterium]